MRVLRAYPPCPRLETALLLRDAAVASPSPLPTLRFLALCFVFCISSLFSHFLSGSRFPSPLSPTSSRSDHLALRHLHHNLLSCIYSHSQYLALNRFITPLSRFSLFISLIISASHGLMNHSNVSCCCHASAAEGCLLSHSATSPRPAHIVAICIVQSYTVSLLSLSQCYHTISDPIHTYYTMLPV